MNTVITSIILSFLLGGGQDIICCQLDESGNNSCTLPGPDGCDSGEKAVVCRYGIWSDPESGAAECVPNGW